MNDFDAWMAFREGERVDTGMRHRCCLCGGSAQGNGVDVETGEQVCDACVAKYGDDSRDDDSTSDYYGEYYM